MESLLQDVGTDALIDPPLRLPLNITVKEKEKIAHELTNPAKFHLNDHMPSNERIASHHQHRAQLANQNGPKPCRK